MCLTVSPAMEYEAATMRLLNEAASARRDVSDILDYLCNRARQPFSKRLFLDQSGDVEQEDRSDQGR